MRHLYREAFCALRTVHISLKMARYCQLHFSILCCLQSSHINYIQEPSPHSMADRLLLDHGLPILMLSLQDFPLVELQKSLFVLIGKLGLLTEEVAQ